MSIFVRITDDCRESARAYNDEACLDALGARVEREQSDGMFDADSKPFWIKKNFGGWAKRLLATKKFVRIGENSHSVLVFLREMKYSDEYGKKINLHAQETYDKEFSGLRELEQKDIEAFVAGRLKEKIPEDERKPLSDSEISYLYNPVSTRVASTDDAERDWRLGLIGESGRWIVSVNRECLKTILVRIRDTVQDIYTCGAPEDGWGASDSVPVDENPAYQVVYQWIDGMLFLCDITGGEGSVDRQGVIPDEILSARNLSQARGYIYREYPAYMTTEDERWTQLEQDGYGNVSLSPEEAALVYPSGTGEVSYPVFIKGRAGSGKSTVLQYLYAEYFARFSMLSETNAAPPVYLACNAKLIEKARMVVKSILRNNPSYAKPESPCAKIIQQRLDDEGFLDGCFKVYREFLLSLIPAGVRETHFHGDGYIDYVRFEREWGMKFSDRNERWKQNFTAEISWYLIRTFIKGGSKNGLLEDADSLRAELVRQGELDWICDAGIDEHVYQEIWSEWYSGLKVESSEGNEVRAWDDQDLVRYVVDNNLFKGPMFMGVFADEAQDFTALDLHFILHTSVFPQKRIERIVDLQHLPFALAGDEFQTLNPTGFSWERLQVGFKGMLINDICPQINLKKFSGLEKRSLTKNFRSRRNVVDFANLIQYWRIRELSIKDESDLLPQTGWFERRGMPVAFYFDTDNDVFWSHYHNLPGLHVLIPCEERGETEYMESHPTLREHIRINDDGTTTPVVLSAMSAKGLEYPCVAVYGFGETYRKIVDENTKREDGAKKLSLSYFINRLYVAVTRAQDQLVILDSEDGYAALWHEFMADNNDGICLNAEDSFVDFNNWDGHVARLHQGLPNYLTGKDIAYDPRRLAVDYRNKGESECDGRYMRLASQFFLQCGDERVAGICRAWALEYEKAHDDAAKTFQEAGEVAMACECLWKSTSDARWARLAELSYLLSDDKSVLSGGLQLARAIVKEDAAALRTALQAFVRKASGTQVDSNMGSSEWHRAIKKALSVFIAHPDCRPETLDRPLLDELGRLGYALSNTIVKKIRYKLVPFPDNLHYVEDGDETQAHQIVDAYRHAGIGKWRLWNGIESEGGLDADQQHALAAAFKLIADGTSKTALRKACLRAVAILETRRLPRGTAFNKVTDNYECYQRTLGRTFAYRLIAYASEDCPTMHDEKPNFVKMTAYLREYLLCNRGNEIGDGLTLAEFGDAFYRIVQDRNPSTADLRDQHRDFFEAGKKRPSLQWESLMEEVLNPIYFGDDGLMTPMADGDEADKTHALTPLQQSQGAKVASTSPQVSIPLPKQATKCDEQLSSNVNEDEVVISIGGFQARYYREARALDLDCEGKRWTIEGGCVKVNRKRRQDLENCEVPIEGTSFVLKCGATDAYLKDATSGLVITISFS